MRKKSTPMRHISGQRHRVQASDVIDGSSIDSINWIKHYYEELDQEAADESYHAIVLMQDEVFVNVRRPDGPTCGEWVELYAIQQDFNYWVKVRACEDGQVIPLQNVYSIPKLLSVLEVFNFIEVLQAS